MEAIHIRRNNPALIYEIGKMNIPKIFNQILGTTYSISMNVSTNATAQQSPSSISSNKATRAITLHN